MSTSSTRTRHNTNKTNETNRGVIVIGFLLCFLAGAGVMCGYEEQRHREGNGASAGAGSQDSPWSDDESPVPVSSKDPTWGRRDAPVTVVVFSDFECPYCGKAEPALEQLRTTYGPEKLRVVWKNQPLSFHVHARPAAEAAQGVFALAGNEAFWKFHDNAFKNNTQLTSESFERWAREAGVTDIAKLRAGLASHAWSEKIDRDMAVAKQAGVTSTPSFLINGAPLIGAQPFDKFKALVDQELAKAQAKIASGTAKDRVYVVMSQENKKNAPQAPADDEPKEDTKTVWNVPIGASPADVEGDARALVTMIAFLDFECPYCKQGDALLRKVKSTYGDKVRLVFKHAPLPFHKHAMPAAELAMEALAEKGTAGFWDAERRIFDAAPKLDDADLDAIASAMSLDLTKLRAARASHAFAKAFEADADLADDLQATSTPTFFINGRRIVGAQPFDKVAKMIDEEIGRAGDLLARGTPRDKLYAALVANGKTPPAPERKDIAVPANAPSKGNAHAKVVVQLFSDYQCPYCARAEDVVRDVMKQYGDRVKLVWRDFPLSFHANASIAAQAAREANAQKGPDAFWKMHDKIFANQKELSRESLDAYARELGLDMNRWKTALDLGTHKAAVDAEVKAATDAGVNGTPALFVNGTPVAGGANASKMRRLIERALAESVR